MDKIISPKFGIQYLYILLMLSFTFQIAGELPIVRRHYIFWLVGFGFALHYASKYFSRPATSAIIAYLFFVWFNFLTRDVYFSKVMNCVEETICFIIPITMLYYLYSKNDKPLFYWVLVVFSFFLIESSIVSFWADNLFPGILRLESNKESALANEAIIGPFRRIGLSSYSLPHALPVIIPGLVYLIKQSKIKVKIPWIIVLIAALVLVYVSGSTTAFLLGGLVLVLSILVSANNRGASKSIIFITVLIIPFVFSQELQLWIIRLLQSYVPDDSLFTRKLFDMEYSILYGDTEGTVGNRTLLYQQSFDGFFSSPIIGTNGNIGGHAALLDRLATLGIVGILPLLYFLYYQVKFTIKNISKEKRAFYYLGLAAGLVMMSVKSMFGWEMWFCVLVMLPGILWWSNNDVTTKDYIKK